MSTDDIWDRADFAADSAWKEMDQFLKELERRGPASTSAQAEQDAVQFLEIQQRCSARAIEIFERAKSGNPAPHLSVVKSKP